MGFKVEGNKLIVDLDLESTELSSSGKTILVASSHGFQYDEKSKLNVSYNITKKPTK